MRIERRQQPVPEILGSPLSKPRAGAPGCVGERPAATPVIPQATAAATTTTAAAAAALPTTSRIRRHSLAEFLQSRPVNAAGRCGARRQQRRRLGFLRSTGGQSRADLAPISHPGAHQTEAALEQALCEEPCKPRRVRRPELGEHAVNSAGEVGRPRAEAGGRIERGAGEVTL